MDDSKQERWLPVVGFEGFYEISDHGNARRIVRDGVTKPIRGVVDVRGYRMFRMRAPGVCKSVKAHRAVLDAFVGPQPRMMGLHRDDCKLNNRLENLRWGTAADNTADWIANGRRRSGPYRNAAKAACLRGHEYTPENTIRKDQGRARECRTCHNEARRARRRAEREARSAGWEWS